MKLNKTELINFDNFPGTCLNKVLFKEQIKPFFTIFTYLTSKNININTINSVLNQTYPNFEWCLICDDSTDEYIKSFLLEKNLNDSRIKLINKNEFSINNFCDFIISLDFETYLAPTLLEVFFSHISYKKDTDIMYTNCISIKNKMCFNQSLISVFKKTINLSTRCICYRKEVHDIIAFKDNKVSILGPCNISHFNFYGVWHELADFNYIKIYSNSFDNYPISTTYNYSTEPNEEPIKLGQFNKEKNILCMIPWQKIGGADLFNYNICKYLKSKGYKIFVVSTEACNYEARQMLENTIEAYYDLTTFMRREDWANFIKSLIVSKNIDLIMQFSSLYGYYLIPWLKYEFPKIPIIDYVHVENFAWRNGGFPKDSTCIAQYLDKTFCCNDHLNKLMFKKMGRTVNNVSTMYIGVDTEKYNPDIVEVTDKNILNFCKNKKVIIFPCRISYEKRPLLMLEIMKKIINKRKDIVCLVIGDGEAKNKLVKAIENNSLSENIKVLDLKKDIRQYYKLADVTLICSLFEGITLTTYESLSMNTPVVSSDVGGQKEVIKRAYGKIIKLYQDQKDINNFNYSEEEINDYVDALIEIINNKDKYTLNNKCRDYIIKNFSIKKIYNDFEKEVSYFIKNGSSFDEKKLNNKAFAIQYLVLFNELNRVYYSTSINENSREEVLMNHWWWRIFAKIANKLKMGKVIDKVIYKKK